MIFTPHSKKNKGKCAIMNQSDLRTIPGLVDSDIGWLANTTGNTEPFIHPLTGQVEQRVSKHSEPAKVVKLAMDGYPAITIELVVWPRPSKDDMKNLCDVVRSFYVKNGYFYTHQFVALGFESKDAKPNERGNNFSPIWSKAMGELEAGKKEIQTIDCDGNMAMSALKEFFG